MSLRIKLSIGTGVGLAIAVALLLLLSEPPGDVGKQCKLPDGSKLLLKQTAFQKNGFTYQQDTTPTHGLIGLLARLQKLLPKRFRTAFSTTMFGMGGTGGTNLFVVTINECGNKWWSSQIGRLQIGDEQGDWYDACWGANTIGMQGQTVHGWGPQAFPRRGKNLTLRFLAIPPNGIWTNYAEFTIPNPAFGTFTQWQAEPWPATKTNGTLAVTLKKFESGEKFQGRRGTGDNKAVARKTRWEFGFNENGTETDAWRIQKLTIHDATGNKWSPYLDFDEQDFTWAKGGTAEMFGALWPAEDAWKIDVEAVRTKGFKGAEVWETEVILPARGTLSTLTNSWKRDNVTVKLASLAAPNVDHPGDLKWTCKWWGEKQNETYSLGLVIPKPGLRGHRVMILGSKDQDGHDVEIVQHGSQDGSPQAVFFRIDKDATRVTFRFALPKSKTVHFTAKPKFITD